MGDLRDELSRMRVSDPDLAQVLDAFAQTDVVYREALKASGCIPDQSVRVANSANIAVSFNASEPGVGSTNR